MSFANPPQEVIDTAAGTGGLIHVGVWIAKAFDQAAARGAGTLNADPARPVMQARADLHKCIGASLACCAGCVRFVAPAASGQAWVEPSIQGGACSTFASLDKYRHLYAAPAIVGSVGEGS